MACPLLKEHGRDWASTRARCKGATLIELHMLHLLTRFHMFEKAWAESNSRRETSIQWSRAVMNMNLVVVVSVTETVLMLATNRGFLGLQLTASAGVCKSSDAARDCTQQRKELTT